MSESPRWTRIEVEARQRLEQDASHMFLKQVDSVLAKFGITRNERSMYPKEYSKHVTTGGDELAAKVRAALNTFGFKFKPVAMHTPTTNAMSASGTYGDIDYIIDVVFRYDELKVDVYF